MTTDAEDALADLYEGRAEAGIAGFRVTTVTLLLGYKGTGGIRNRVAVREIPIVEAQNQPPRVRSLKDEEITVGNLASGTVEIGPITPKFPGGGTDIADIRGDELRSGEERHLRLTGPSAPSGDIYVITKIDTDRALRIMLQAKPIEPGFP